MLITSWIVLLFFGPENVESSVFKKEFKILIYLTSEQLPTLSQSIFNELWLRKDGSISGSCLHMASCTTCTADDKIF